MARCSSPSEERARGAHRFAGVVVDSADVERVVLIAALTPGAREPTERPAASTEQEPVAERQGIFAWRHGS